jgi:hypothetical protein
MNSETVFLTHIQKEEEEKDTRDSNVQNLKQGEVLQLGRKGYLDLIWKTLWNYSNVYRH